MESPGFVHLHTHSSYSLREGAMPIAKLIGFATADAMPALAITDTTTCSARSNFPRRRRRPACSR